MYMKKGFITKKDYSVVDHLGNRLPVNDLTLIFGRSSSYLHSILRLHPCSTLKEVVKLDPSKYRKGFTDKIPNNDSALFTVYKVAVAMDRSVNWVKEKMEEDPSRTVEDLVKLDDKYIINMSSEGLLVGGIVKFKRGEFCYRNDKEDQCIHYSSCQSARIRGNHHERFKTDGSCYEFYDKKPSLTSNLGSKCSISFA